MKKKKTIITALIGWIMILGSIIGILNGIKPQTYFKLKNAGVFYFTIYIVGFIRYLLSIICGFYILNLKSWSRKLLIVLCLVNIILAALSFKVVTTVFPRQERFAILEQGIRAEFKGDEQKQTLGILREYELQSQRRLHIFLIIVISITFLWNSFNIYYFSRPNIREQFN